MLRIIPALLILFTATFNFTAHAQPDRTLGETVRVSGPAYDFPHFEPHLAVNPTDPQNMIAAAMAVPAEGEGHTLRLYVTFDGGTSWSHTPLDTTAVYGGDPWLAFGPQGTAYFTGLPGRLYRSEDGGRSWSSPATIPMGEALERGGGAFDYPKLLVDRTGGPYHGRLYHIASQGDYLEGKDNPVFPIAVNRSVDGGRSFSFPSHILPGDINYQNGKPALLSDGTLVVTFNEISHQQRVLLDSPRHWITRSTDGGRTFDTPRLLDEDFIAYAPHLAADTTSERFRDRLYAIWSTGPDDQNAIFASHSSDRGYTWSEAQTINDVPSHRPVNHPATAVNRNGVLGVFWLDTRSDSTGNCFTPYFTASTDGGASYTRNFPLSDQPSCNDTPANRVAFSGSGTTVFDRWASGGDYFGLVALPDGSFQALWADSRAGVFQLWTRRISLRQGDPGDRR